MKPSIQKMVTVGITLPYDLRKSAAESGLNVSQVCRNAISNALREAKNES